MYFHVTEKGLILTLEEDCKKWKKETFSINECILCARHYILLLLTQSRGSQK
ncbi:hypothetical protein I79_011756 [Cricetulus griseus]|uniref:Uncharacterized protein n=1 Tax=Cricetulus griseus TaxID=10029 RepID=G3HM12_CRIGR|nr:hypothetical protein I79_011756 [Cricetulus griseus]